MAEKESMLAGDTDFICGVVEGFYGRPWTTEQRKDLFKNLKKWGMDSYVYAPKDDYKHRAYWRELYTVEEADHLSSLISAAKEHNITFYYALSPGLDMTYSNAKEVSALKRKLEQVSRFGCDAFALLFDDIEPEMSKTDKEVFQTFAHAQVSVTNEISSHLNRRRFLFCPTQYCSTRAVPTVMTSEYLNTLGTKLSQDIDILWTGPKVISKQLNVDAIQEITEILRRPPVIWDNLHANDYDQKRVFLGPYSGRSPELIPLLRGVLTNPNCEFHANTIAIHTLAHWSKCSTDARINNSISADIKLETENEEGISGEEAPLSMSKNCYHPKFALKNAIRDWLPEFYVAKNAWGPITKPHPAVTMVMPVIPIIPSINTCMSLTTTTTVTTTTVSTSSTNKLPEVNTTQLQALAEVCSTVTGADSLNLPNVVMNSLVSPTKVVTNDSIPNPLVSSVVSNMSALPMPLTIPVSSTGTPIVSMDAMISETTLKLGESNKNCDKAIESDRTLETIDEDEPIDDKKQDEPMPIEDDTEPGAQKKLNPSNDINHISDKVSDVLEVDSLNGMDEQITAGTIEPMECTSFTQLIQSTNLTQPKSNSKCNNSSGANSSDDVVMSESGLSTSSTGSMQVENSDMSAPLSPDMATDTGKLNGETDEISETDLNLLCDLFYLPFEHGSRSLQLLNEFYWLKTNSTVLVSGSKKKLYDLENAKPEVQEWFQRSNKFYIITESIINLAKKIAICANKELCHDLYSYLWEMAGVVILLNAFVKWLSLGSFPANINSYTQGSYTWFSKGWRETFSSGDQEPWVFRGGLTADLQRLIPIDSGNDLFLYKLPDVPTTLFYRIRPYEQQDEKEVYSICHLTCRDGYDCSELFPDNLQTIPADRLVGPFVTINPEMCMVIENGTNKPENYLAGYACAALDAKLFYRNQEICWIPAMCLKYPLSLLDADDLTQTARDSINHFHHFKYDCPVDVLNAYPSIMTCCILKDYVSDGDQSITKRLVTVLLAALRSNGSFGVHACINETDRNIHQFYSKIGFVEVFRDVSNGRIYMGRNF